MQRRARDLVVVITGASSGVGREAALEFARRGAAVTLIGRREQALHELAAECERAGGRALVGAADVTDEAAVQDVARRTVEAFGRIDVWVNNAAVALFGLFEETPSRAYRRVIETNVFGTIHGARAALPQFRRQGSGVLINICSAVCTLPGPFISAYLTSKCAIRGLSQSLRQELLLLGEDNIHVCTVMPSSINTPLFRTSSNYTGKEPTPMPPVYPAERVVRAIMRLVEEPRREVYVGNSGRVFTWFSTLAPGAMERLLAFTYDNLILNPEKASPHTDGNLFVPMAGTATVSGGWRYSGVIPDLVKRSFKALRALAAGSAHA